MAVRARGAAGAVGRTVFPAAFPAFLAAFAAAAWASRAAMISATLERACSASEAVTVTAHIAIEVDATGAFDQALQIHHPANVEPHHDTTFPGVEGGAALREITINADLQWPVREILLGCEAVRIGLREQRQGGVDVLQSNGHLAASPSGGSDRAADAPPPPCASSARRPPAANAATAFNKSASMRALF